MSILAQCRDHNDSGNKLRASHATETAAVDTIAQRGLRVARPRARPSSLWATSIGALDAYRGELRHIRPVTVTELWQSAEMTRFAQRERAPRASPPVDEEEFPMYTGVWAHYPMGIN